MIPFTCYESQARILALRTLSQSHPEFWSARSGRARFISASEVPILCGFGGRDRTVQHLLNEKRYGVEPKHNDYVQSMIDEGKRREPLARQWFSSEYNCPVMETGLWVHPVDQRLSASPDALCWMAPYGQVPLEIKCPFDKRTKITNTRVHKDSLQLQTQIQCTQSQCGFLLYFYAPDDPDNLVFFVQSDWSLWLEIVAHAHWFIGLLQKEERPLNLSGQYDLNIKRYATEFIEYCFAAQQQSKALSHKRAGDHTATAQLELAESGDADAAAETTEGTSKRRRKIPEEKAEVTPTRRRPASDSDN